MANKTNKSFEMEQVEERLSKMLFVVESTSRNDYQKTDLKQPTRTAYVDKPKIEHKKEFVYPFYKAVGDPDREEAQKTRPRLVMTPASSLDDVVDPEKRKTIINDIYESTVNHAQRQTAAVAFPVDKNIKSPLPDTYAPARPIDIPKWQPKSVPAEWRMETRSWDRQQHRGYVDPTGVFWEHSPLRYRVEREN